MAACGSNFSRLHDAPKIFFRNFLYIIQVLLSALILTLRLQIFFGNLQTQTNFSVFKKMQSKPLIFAPKKYGHLKFD